jgi:2-polyprenyl-3-methyl-5-hydroxy-6-metoxy-1,4-benzoquinol methylase
VKCEPVPYCPICGASGPVVRADCPDPIFGLTGPWSFRACEVCETWWLDPRPAPEEVPGLYGAGYYTHVPPPAPLAAPRTPAARLAFAFKLALVEHAFDYAGLSRRARPALGALGRLGAALPPLVRWAGFFVRFVPARPGGRLLEAGSGNGAFLAQMRALGWAVQGIEPDPGAARQAQAAGLDVQTCTVEDAVLATASFDAITMQHVLEHVADPRATLARLASAIRPGGLLVSISPNPRAWLGGRFGPAWRGLEPPRHHTLPGTRAYRRMLEPLGFRVRTWTSLRTAGWMTRESLAIRRRGRAQPPDAGPRAAWWIARARLAALVDAEAGEEVICVAQKAA